MAWQHCIFVFCLTADLALGESHWPQFRGPEATGIGVGDKPPVRFGPAHNLLWQTPLPSGHSSPCIWDERIFLTACMSPQELETICLKRENGQILWRKAITIDHPETAAESAAADSNPASSTPATDGTNVCSYFGSFGLLCYDFTGREQWRMRLPTPKSDFGTGTSPIIHAGRVILNRDQNGESFVLAVDIHNGQVIWKTERPLFVRGFTTPLIYHGRAGDEVVVAGNIELCAYDFQTGMLRWLAGGLPSYDVCPSPIAAEGLIFAGGISNEGQPARFKLQGFDELLPKLDKNKDGKLQVDEFPKVLKAFALAFDSDRDGEIGRKEWDRVIQQFARGENGILAVRPGDSANSDHFPFQVTNTVWHLTRGAPRVATPLCYQGRLYVVKDDGIITCARAADGTVLFSERLGEGGQYFSSPVAADSKVYVGSKRGIITVLQVGDTLKVLQRNDLSERLYATPAIVEGKLYVRGTRHLFAFGEK